MVDKGAGKRQQADLELGRKLHCFDTDWVYVNLGRCQLSPIP